MRAQLRSLAVAVVISTACSGFAIAASDDASTPVSTALANLETWLGTGPNAAAWATYLNSKGLHAELKKGNEADRAVIDGVVKQLDGDAAGLQMSRFRAVREALAQWSDELAITQAPDLAEAARSAEPKFHPVTAADAAGTKAVLETALDKLNRYLRGDNGRAWRDYLQWNALEDQLKSAAPDVNALASVYQQYTADHVGLETPVFADVAVALDRYISVLAAQNEQLKQQYAAQLQSLADELKRYTDSPSEELAYSLGGRLGWLQRMRQAPALSRVIRRRYSHPNLYVAASARLVAAGIDLDVDDTRPVRDFILGTDIRGTGHTLGRVTAKLVPSDENATIDILLNGQTQTRNVGYNGPVTIYTNGTVQISGSKRVLLDASGFKSYPAKGDADVSTRVTGIGARHRIVQKIASRKVGQQKSEAEDIAADHAAVQVRGRVDDQSGTQLSKAHADYIAQFRNPLVRRREFPELLQFRTTQDTLFIVGQKANRMQLGAPGDPPAVEGDYDLVLRVHESMINNMAAAVLAGVTLREEEVQKKVIDLRGELPENLKSEPDRDPWSITFASVRPVTITFADDGFRVTIRGQRYTSGDRDFQSMNVSANYKVEISGHGARMVRQGELDIAPPNFVAGKSRLTAQQISLRTLLERRFGKLLEPEMKSEGLELPGNWKKAGRLDLKVLQSKAGWLALAWIESGEPVKEDPPKDKDKVVLDNR